MRAYKQLICVFLGTASLLAYAMSKFIAGRVIVAITAASFLGFLIALIHLARDSKDATSSIKTILATLALVMIDTYLGLFFVVNSYQDVIANKTGTFFQPHQLSVDTAQALTSPQVENIDLITPDGIRLHGWLVHHSDPWPAPLIIYFGGSGSESSEMIPVIQQLNGWSVALINYRGFGLSQGKPSQEKVFADAIFLYDTFSKRSDIDPHRTVSMGYSLGTGVAVYLSEHRPVAGTILVAPYDSLSLVGLKQPLIYAPVSGIMKRYFDSISRAPTITTPLLCLIGANDQAVPPERSLRLANMWGGNTMIKTYPSEDHGLLLHSDIIWSDIAAFLEKID